MSPIPQAPYGSWKSPITSDLIVKNTVRLSQIQLDGDDVYWVEMRPSDNARNVVVKRDRNGAIADATLQNFNVRTRAHEYGGAAYAVKQGRVCFSNDGDGRLYHQESSGRVAPISPNKSYRFAEPIFDDLRNRVIGIMENHTAPGREATNNIVAVDLRNPGEPYELVGGSDFYSNPIISPDGRYLAWLAWNHPNMPWDGTELWLAEFNDDGKTGMPRKIAGELDISIFQPQWSPGGVLHFVSDENGWWNIYRWQNGRTECLYAIEAEFGLPQWVFGMSTYAFVSDNKLICAYFENSVWKLAFLHAGDRKLQPIELPFTFIDDVKANTQHAVFIAGSAISANAIVQLDLKTLAFEVLRYSTRPSVDPSYFSRPEVIEFPTENGQTAYAYFYPPQNPDYRNPGDSLPPLIVKSHGGPTGCTAAVLDLRFQFWTSRGFALLDVNYGGSTGYGRDYRHRLDGNWGVTDVFDCVNAAKYLAQQKRVDVDKLIITGGSAGGYTTLCALTFHDTFKAGASYYGIADLESMAMETHKFESRYLDRMIGPYPECKELYQQRSPIHFTDQLSCPIILMQGLEDRIVAPSQAERMLASLRAKGLPVAYLAFEGEQHGFRQASTIKRSLEAELYFYSQIFDFEIADPIEPIEIENLKARP